MKSPDTKRSNYTIVYNYGYNPLNCTFITIELVDCLPIQDNFSFWNIISNNIWISADYKLNLSFLKRQRLNSWFRYSESVHGNSMMDMKYVPKDNMPRPEVYYDRTKMEKTGSTYYLDSNSISKENEFGNIYGKLSSELNNLRSEINNLKSDRGDIESSRNLHSYNKISSIGNMKTFTEENASRYLMRQPKMSQNKPLTRKPLQGAMVMNQIRGETQESDFTEMDKLNDLEAKLNNKNSLDEALEHDTESDAMSYDQSDNDHFHSEIDPQYYGRSENQSPNQESYRQHQLSSRNQKQVFWNIANGMGSDHKANPAKKLVPSLNMERVHNAN